MEEKPISDSAGGGPMSGEENWLRRAPGDHWAAIVPSEAGLDPAVLDVLASVGLGCRAISPDGRTHGTRPNLVLLNLFSIADRRARPAAFTEILRSLLDSPLAGIPVVVLEPAGGDMVGWAGGYDARIIWPRAADQLRSIITRLMGPRWRRCAEDAPICKREAKAGTG